MIDLKIYSFDGCVDTPATIDRVKKIAGVLNLEIKISLIEISTAEDAERPKFPGSPTVRINGLDIDPEMRDAFISD